MSRVDEWFRRLDELDYSGLRQFEALLLAAFSVESSGAPAQALSQVGPGRSGDKPGSRAPRAVSPGCRCGCRSEGEHWARFVEGAREQDLVDAEQHNGDGCARLRGALRVAYGALRPDPVARAAAREDSGDREKRILSEYVGVSPEDAAVAEMQLNPWAASMSGSEVRWRAESIRKLRRSAERNPETGEREAPDDVLRAQAQRLRDAGMSLRVVGRRVGRSHMWVDRNTRAREAA